MSDYCELDPLERKRKLEALVDRHAKCPERFALPDGIDNPWMKSEPQPELPVDVLKKLEHAKKLRAEADAIEKDLIGEWKRCQEVATQVLNVLARKL